MVDDDDPWEAILPVPNDIPDPGSMHHRNLGDPVKTWTYRDENGDRNCFIARFDKPDGEKEFRPRSFCRNTKTGEKKWRWKAPLPPRPLYGLEFFARQPSAKAMVVEGEKCVDHSRPVFPDWIPISPMNGAKSPHLADWEPLRGRDVVICGDNDDAGKAFVQTVGRILLDLGCQISVVDIGALAALAGVADLDGFDIADAAQLWNEPDSLRAAVIGLIRPFVPEAVPDTKRDDNDVLPPPSNPMQTAREFVARHCLSDGTLILRYWRDGWWRWDTTCWRELELRYVVSRLYLFTEHAVYWIEGEGEGSYQPWAPNRRKIGDLAEALGAICILRDDVNQPCWLDGRRTNGVVVACANGLLEIEKRELLPHSPTFFNNVAVPFSYDPHASPPAEWLDFLQTLWPGDKRPEILVLGEWYGYVISGLLHLHKILATIGPTRGGKGVIARVLSALVGPANVAGPTLRSLGREFGLQSLMGKTLAIVADARFAGVDQIVVERLLSISGEVPLTVDRKYRDGWTGKLPCRLQIISNEMPKLTDASAAIIGRMVPLILTQSWLGREDHALEDRIQKELPGVLNWALDGLRRLTVDNGNRFTRVPGTEETMTQMRDLASPVAAFVREECDVGKADYEVEVDALYKVFKLWAENNGHTKKSKLVFGRDLHAVLPLLKKPHQKTEGDRRARYYSGLRLKSYDREKPENKHPDLDDPDYMGPEP